VRFEEKSGEKNKLAKKLVSKPVRLRKENQVENEKEGEIDVGLTEIYQYTNDNERETEIDVSLAEIYQNSADEKFDVNRMKIRRKQGLVFWFFNILIFSLVVIVLGLGAYYYIVYGKGKTL